MKILYGITKSNFGGAQRYVYELAVEAKKQGHDTAVMCGEEGHLVERLRAAEIRVISVPGFGRDMDLLRDAPRLLFIIKKLHEERPDVFHINSAKMGGAGIFSGRLLGIKKIIFTSHGWAFNEGWRPWWQKISIKFFSWLTIIGAHKTICVSERTREQVANWPLVKNKLVVVKNGISKFETLPSPTAREKVGVTDPGLLLVGTIGELHKIKGHDILLAAWQKFTLGRRARLIIVGSGEEQAALERLTQELGLTDSVIFTGYVEDARRVLPAFDIYVFPSRSENLPYAVLEAGFAERPVIATSVGGIPEIIENGVNGALIPPEDPDALLSSLILFHDNPRMRDRLGLELKKTISGNFTFKKMARETFAHYS